MDDQGERAHLHALREGNVRALARAEANLARSYALAAETARLLDRASRLVPPSPDDACPVHPRAGGVGGAEAIEFSRGTLVVPCMRCRVCGEAYLTRAQAGAAEFEAARRSID